MHRGLLKVALIARPRISFGAYHNLHDVKPTFWRKLGRSAARQAGKAGRSRSQIMIWCHKQWCAQQMLDAVVAGGLIDVLTSSHYGEWLGSMLGLCRQAARQASRYRGYQNLKSCIPYFPLALAAAALGPGPLCLGPRRGCSPVREHLQAAVHNAISGTARPSALPLLVCAARTGMQQRAASACLHQAERR